MNEYKVAIVVPIYNVEHFLMNCLRSIQKQTYTNWRCLCIDDGSIDESSCIVQDFIRRDARFSLFIQKNRGVALARQRGLDNVQGQWLAWIDPDDWVDECFLEHLLDGIDSTDMVWSDLIEEVDGGSLVRKQKCVEVPSIWANNLIKKDGLWGGLVNKVFRLNLIRENELSFKLLSVCEDACFLLQYLSVAHKIEYRPYAEYHYRIRKGSLCHSTLDTITRIKREISVQYTLESLALSFDVGEELRKRRQWIKFSWYDKVEVSDDLFEQIFPEIKDVDVLPIALFHKVLFRLACRRWRPLIRFVFLIGRKLKRGGWTRILIER